MDTAVDWKQDIYNLSDEHIDLAGWLVILHAFTCSALVLSVLLRSFLDGCNSGLLQLYKLEI